MAPVALAVGKSFGKLVMFFVAAKVADVGVKKSAGAAKKSWSWTKSKFKKDSSSSKED